MTLPGFQGLSGLGSGSNPNRFSPVANALMKPVPVSELMDKPVQTLTSPLTAPIQDTQNLIKNPVQTLTSPLTQPIQQTQQLFKSPVKTLADPLGLFGFGSSSQSVRGYGGGRPSDPEMPKRRELK